MCMPHFVYLSMEGNFLFIYFLLLIVLKTKFTILIIFKVIYFVSYCPQKENDLVETRDG